MSGWQNVVESLLRTLLVALMSSGFLASGLCLKKGRGLNGLIKGECQNWWWKFNKL